MNSTETGSKIRNKAVELGFENCGILKISELDDYKKLIDQRYADKPELKYLYGLLKKLSEPQKSCDWAKSIIICVNHYGKFKIPENIDKYIAKLCLFDYKQEKTSDGYLRVSSFESFLSENNIKFLKDVVYGVAPMRYLAQKANLGIIRKNNFFYTGKGSWVSLESWLIDEDAEYIAEKEVLSPCPDNCRLCIEACPTKALNSAYEFDFNLCVTRLLYGASAVTPENLRDKIGCKVYGCDDCQNACPNNNGRWIESVDYPGIENITPYLKPEKILEMKFEEIVDIFGKKFWFISKEKPWVWKCNAIISMTNEYKPEYRKYFLKFSEDENEFIRETALWALRKSA